MTKKWKEKVQKNAQFSFRGGRKAFHQEIVLRGIQPCFLHGGAPWSVLNATKAAKFSLNFQVHFAPYGQENYVFEREFMYVYSFIDVLYMFFFGATEKLQNAPRFEMDFVLNFAMCLADFTCVNGSTIQIVSRELL